MTLKLEVGKSYRNRLGEIITITNEDIYSKFRFSDDNGNEFTNTGHYYTDCEYSSNDLIEEVKDLSQAKDALPNSILNLKRLDLALVEVLETSVSLEQLQRFHDKLTQLNYTTGAN